MIPLPLMRTVRAHVEIQLKCSGERGGCRRCLASSAECTYGPDAEGQGNGSRPGRSRGATKHKQRRRQPAQPSSSTVANDRPLPMTQHGRTNVELNGPSPRSRDAENGNGRRRDVNDWNTEGGQMSPSALPDSTQGASTRTGSSLDATPSNDWCRDLLDFNDFTDLSGGSPSFGLGSMNSPVDEALVNTVVGMAPEHLSALSQPPSTGTPARAPSTSSAAAAVSVPDSPSPLTAHDSVLRSSRTSTGLSRAGGGCQCLANLASILERLGRYRLGDKPKTDNNLDCLLFCLGSGVSTCNKTLSCKVCDACQDHSILLATIAEQLGHICNDLCGCLLVHQHKARAANTEAPSDSPPPPPPLSPADASSGNPQPETEGDKLVGGEISFGRYHIQGADMRLRLIQNLMALHMTDLLALLDQLTQRIGQVDGATGMLAGARKTAHTAHWMLQRLRSEP